VIVLLVLPAALLCGLIAWMCLRRGYRRHAVALVLLAASVVAVAVSLIALCWLFWIKIAAHFA